MNLYQDEGWLYSKYIENRLTTIEIATMLNCAKTTIRNWLKKHNIPFRTVQKEIYVCDTCGQHFKRLHSASKNNNHHFCNRKCYEKFWTQHIQPRVHKLITHPSWTEERRILMKDKLKNRHFTPEWRNKISTSKMGEKNAMWKGGITKFRRSLIANIRTLPEYTIWKRAILMRDVVSYPQIPKKVQVHHLKSITQIVKDNNIQCLENAKKCKELWDINNGLALYQGEHYFVTILNRHKQFSKYLIDGLKKFVDENKDRAVDIGSELLKQ